MQLPLMLTSSNHGTFIKMGTLPLVIPVTELQTLFGFNQFVHSCAFFVSGYNPGCHVALGPAGL